MEPGEAADMVDVRVGANDSSNFEIVAPQNLEDALDFVTRVHHDCVARGRIAQH